MPELSMSEVVISETAQKQKPFKVTVLGAGAIGQLWVRGFLKSKLESKLSSSSRLDEQLPRQISVAVWGKSSSHSEFDFRVQDLAGNQQNYSCAYNDLLHLKQTDLLLVCLKSYQIAAGLLPLLQHLSKHCAIVLLHNGMGVLESIQADSISNTLFQAITTQAAFRDADLTIHTANGKTEIGLISSYCSSVYQQEQKISPPTWLPLLAKALPIVEWNPNIQLAQWKKLAINALINPLTVKYQCLNGELIKYQAELQLLANELATLFAQLALPFSATELFNTALTVIQNTANNRSSMLQDTLANRPTEIDFITGYILERARLLDLVLPAHQSLYDLVKG